MLTGFLQTRQAQKRTPVANKQMGMVMRVLPVFFGLISLQFPAGLVLYFFVSNLWRLGQQEIIFRRFGSALTPSAGGKALPGGKKTAVIDAESREAVRDEPNGGEPAEDDAPPTQPKAAAAKPKPKASGSTSGASSPTTPRRGLRAMFELPPPPEPNGGGAPTRSANGGSSGASKATPKPPPAPKRSNKKKRRR